MALLRDMVKETTVTQGNGTIFLLGAAPGGFSPFENFFSNGEEVTYAQFQVNSGWEVCRGQFLTGPPRLTKDYVYASMLGLLQPVTWGEGTRDVYCTLPASEILTVTEAATVLASTFLTKAGNLAGLANTGTSQTHLGGTVTGKALFTAADAAAGRTALALGTAATKNTGTAAGNVPELLAGSPAKLPALDVSNCVGFPAGSSASVPAGAVTDWYMAAAPTGWTRITTIDDKVPIIVSAGSPGTTNAATWGITGLSAAAHALTIAEIPAHTHNVAYGVAQGIDGGTSAVDVLGAGSNSATSTSVGGGGSHAHSVTSNASWRPPAAFMLLASKN